MLGTIRDDRVVPSNLLRPILGSEFSIPRIILEAAPYCPISSCYDQSGRVNSYSLGLSLFFKYIKAVLGSMGEYAAGWDQPKPIPARSHTQRSDAAEPAGWPALADLDELRHHNVHTRDGLPRVDVDVIETRVDPE